MAANTVCLRFVAMLPEYNFDFRCLQSKLDNVCCTFSLYRRCREPGYQRVHEREP